MYPIIMHNFSFMKSLFTKFRLCTDESNATYGTNIHSHADSQLTDGGNFHVCYIYKHAPHIELSVISAWDGVWLKIFSQSEAFRLKRKTGW